LPFGGACMFKGQDGEDSMAPEVFGNASVFGRIATVAAGPVANFLLAFFLSFFIIGSIGYDPPVISGVMPGYPAEAAGLRKGDEIKKLGNTNIVVYRDISSYTMFFQGKSTEVVYERDGETYTTTIAPVYNEELDRYLFGISGSEGRVKATPIEMVRYSLHEVYYWVDISYKSLGMIFQGRVTRDDVAGPVGIATAVGETYDISKENGAFYVWLNMVNLTVLISANLGVMNLLPLPALDGGRLVFLLLEVVRRKRIDPEKEAMVHFAGVVVLLVFMIFVLFNDIDRVFRGGF
ncbi:MAG: site-2 protease family protein, partial [Lachnospiraceae bacterium]|nr:site-2 protease family protein [Lachnospiraceae bacterium]